MHAPVSKRAPQAGVRALLTLAWPVVLARATQSVIGFCDALMVAPLGEDALAATITGGLNAFAFIIFPMGTVFIVQSFTAQLRGRGQLESVPRYALYGLLVALLAGLLALLAIPTMPYLLSKLEYSAHVRTLMYEYLAVRLLSVAPAVGMEALGNWFGGLGNTRPAMVSSVVAMVTNVALCYLLIEPRFGLPGYGVAGSALAGTLGTTCGFGVIVVQFLNDPRRAPPGAMLAPQRSEFARMLRFGLPNGMNWFLEFAAFSLFINVVIGHLGTTVLAAFNVMLQLCNLSFMPTFGLASAGSILAGEAIGRRAFEEVWPVVRLTAKVACISMGTVGVGYGLFAAELMRWFRPPGTEGAEFVALGTSMLIMASFWQLFDALAITFSEALRAAGDTTWAMGARIVLAWGFFTPFAWLAIFEFGGGVPTVMGSLMAYMAGLSLTFALRFRSGKWKQIQLIQALY